MIQTFLDGRLNREFWFGSGYFEDHRDIGSNRSTKSNKGRTGSPSHSKRKWWITQLDISALNSLLSDIIPQKETKSLFGCLFYPEIKPGNEISIFIDRNEMKSFYVPPKVLITLSGCFYNYLVREY